MSRPKRPNFKPEFRLDVAQLVLDKSYSIREAADAMDVVNPLLISGFASLNKSEEAFY
jgi:transposase-like protein